MANKSLIDALVKPTAGKVVDRLVASPSIDAVTPTNAPIVQAVVEKALEREMAPVLANATNSEPWYQSRVILGAVVTLLALGAKMFFGWNIDQDTQGLIIEFVPAAIMLGGLGLTLYGRLAKGLKPIGS